MTPVLLRDGEPVHVLDDGDRIGQGPWARWLASAVVPDEGSARAERGRGLARSGAVRLVTVDACSVTARVEDAEGMEHTVSLDAPALSERTWAAVIRTARRRPQLEPAVEGAAQSVHLAHAMETEHGVPLVPQTRAIRRGCTCPAAGGDACEHVAALAFVVADALDADPSLLLLWRGCTPATPPASRSDDPWQAGAIPPPRPPRRLPPGAVVKRLGRSGIRVGGEDLADALAPAYRAFATLDSGSSV